MTLDLPMAAGHGALIALVASSLLVAVLWFNPRLLMRHQPLAHRQAVAPLSRPERMAGIAVGLLLLGLLAGGPLASAVWFARAHAEADRLDVALHAFMVGMVFNLVDWLILDELWLGLTRPRWALMPGTEDIPFTFDHAQQARGFAIGTVLFAIVAAAAALVAG